MMPKGSSIKRSGNNNTARNGLSRSGQPSKKGTAHHSDGDYLIQMQHAPDLAESSGMLQMLPVLLFTAAIILIVHLHPYTRSMDQYFWSQNENTFNDYFSYYKMVAILICAVAALVILLYRFLSSTLLIKKSYAYIPMIIYVLFVLLSYYFSDYKIFSLWGGIERFEGTAALLSYMVLLFYIINTVNSERNVKWLMAAISGSSIFLGLLGFGQALGYDLFTTNLGIKMIVPVSLWNNFKSSDFSTKIGDVYQTVYNNNYVSFYLALLIPLFALLFIHLIERGNEEPRYKKILSGGIFALAVFNMISSHSSGGMLGLGFSLIISVFVLHRNIIVWRKPVLLLLIITAAVVGICSNQLFSELLNSAEGVTGVRNQHYLDKKNIEHQIDYIETAGNDIIFGYNGKSLVFTTYPDDPISISIKDSENRLIGLRPVENNSTKFTLDDDRYDWITVQPAYDKTGNHYIRITTDEHGWPFIVSEGGTKYYNGMKKLVDLKKVPAIGWKDNQSFGTGRGYIWSRTIPMLKETLLLGHGADTFCFYFPQNDYVGKYDSGKFSDNLDIIIDKPHNLYFGYAIGSGMISVAALLALWLIYLAQSFMLYLRIQYSGFLEYCGIGIFLGISGFLVAALVNDSSVSVMPMFYGLLGTGISVNKMLIRDKSLKEKVRS